MKDLIDQARNGSFAAPVEIYVRIDEFVGDRVSPRQLLQGEAQPAALLREAFLTLTAPTHRTRARHAYVFMIGAAVIRRRLADYATSTVQASPTDVLPLSMETVDALLPPDPSLSAVPAAAMGVLDAALDELEAQHADQAQPLECRLFGGMPIDLIALALGRSPDCVQAEDASACAWMRRHLTRSAG